MFMKRSLITLFTMLASLALVLPCTSADEPANTSKLQDKLVGTWKMVSAKYGGRENKFPEGYLMVKHITPTQFMWATSDAEGNLTRAAGGGYTLKGDLYEETPKYGLSEDFQIIKGKAQTFRCKIDGNTWHHDGKLSNGVTIEEVWERVEK